jgi:hypothetical protein
MPLYYCIHSNKNYKHFNHSRYLYFYMFSPDYEPLMLKHVAFIKISVVL